MAISSLTIIGFCGTNITGIFTFDFNRHLLQEIEIQNGGNFDRLLVLQIYDVIYIALLKNKRI